ncbi:permease [Breznakiella homolactica]|uniref:Permease n=1 Tax=Breznakiella homolactica TaxID=2798577 RepID=A0A7T7XM22_9SPIR|nr:permease [Breznakiella homolactica]QQO08707.1 permease [Breznakiella homolactica]
MLEILRREWVYFWYYFTVQLEQVFPYWVLGILIGSVISVFGKEKIHALLGALQGKRLGILGVVPASLIGIASPLCMYGTIPIAASFSEKGVKDDWLAAFMMSSILLNPQLLIYSASLGTRVLLIRLVTCFICGMAAGLLVRIFYRNKSFFNFSGFGASASRDTDPNPMLRLLKNIWRNIKATGIYFLIGIVLSALFQRYVPASVVEKLFGNNRGFGVLMAATIGVPLYACGGGTIPLISGWLANGMSLGSAAAFMITGPATKITNLGAMKIVLGMRRFILYIVFSIAFAWICGMAVDLIF